MTAFFYDSYAVIEYLKENPSYTEYFEQNDGMITLLNLLEVYYSSLQEEGEEYACQVYDRLLHLVVQPTKTEVKKAMRFKLLNKKQNLSYADCLGYCVALERGVLFLTGDKEFKHLPGVKWVEGLKK